MRVALIALAFVLAGCAAPAPEPGGDAALAPESVGGNQTSEPTSNETVGWDDGWGWATNATGPVGVRIQVETNETAECELYVGFSVRGERKASVLAGSEDGWWLARERETTGSVDAAGQSESLSGRSQTDVVFSSTAIQNGSHIFAIFQDLENLDFFVDGETTAAMGLTCDRPTRPAAIQITDAVDLFAVSDFDAPADVEAARQLSGTVSGSIANTLPAPGAMYVRVVHDGLFVDVPHSGTLAASGDWGDASWDLSGAVREIVPDVFGKTEVTMTGAGGGSIYVGFATWDQGRVPYEMFLLKD